MSIKTVTLLVVAVGALTWLAYDAWAALIHGYKATISKVYKDVFAGAIWLAFLLGFVMVHIVNDTIPPPPTYIRNSIVAFAAGGLCALLFWNQKGN